jgi:hypothetical protein
MPARRDNQVANEPSVKSWGIRRLQVNCRERREGGWFARGRRRLLGSGPGCFRFDGTGRVQPNPIPHRTTDPPPLNWSSLKYVMEEDRNAEKGS